MLKKMLKSCLAIAMACAMAAPVYADLSTGGRVRASLAQSSVKDGASYLDMYSDAQVKFHAEGEMDNGWTGFARLRLEYEEDATTLDQNYKYVGIKNDSLEVRLGREYRGGVFPLYGYWVGSHINAAGLMFPSEYGYKDGLSIKLPMGLGVTLAMNKVAGTAGNYKETFLMAQYSKSFGALRLSAQFASIGEAVDEKDAAGSPKDGVNDGGSTSDIGLGIGYKLSDTMTIGFDYDMKTTKAGNADDATANTVMELGVGMGLGEGSKLMAVFGSKAEVTGDADAIATSKICLDYSMTITGSVRAYVGYGSYSTTNPLTDTTTGMSKVGGGMRYDF